MKSAVRFVLLVFVLFLATPTIVGAIKKSADTSFFYSMSEEELSHNTVKAILKENTALNFNRLESRRSAVICFENLSRHDNVWASIFIPPPDRV